MEQRRQTTMTNLNSVIKTWQTFQQHIKAPETEADYLELLEFTTSLIEKYDTNTEPYRSLWRVLAGYALEWEKHNEPKPLESSVGELLQTLMDAHGLTQYKLAQEGVVNQSALSKILRGERGIGKVLAKRFANRFQVPASIFLV
jgi:antitoxin component HigA of HigAB toxin-antitoxin module